MPTDAEVLANVESELAEVKADEQRVTPAGPPVSGSTVTLALAESEWQIHTFDPSIEGVPVITSEGTAVPEAVAAQIIDEATASGITIERR